MKHKVLYLLAISCLLSFTTLAQRATIKIGYIDTDYILQNVPEYQEANVQLEQKVQQWKAEIDERNNEIDLKKKQLNSERVLLTNELYQERLEDISFEEAALLEYQQKRFGPNGDLMLQKKQLVQPIQDQIFAAVQEIATSRHYDFIFDKSADVVMLYSSARFDISELIIRSLASTARRTQAQSRAAQKAAQDQALIPEINKAAEAREAAAKAKQEERQRIMEERKATQEARRDSIKAAADARRQQVIDQRLKAKAAKDSLRNKAANGENTNAQTLEERRAQLQKNREARKKALEERRKKILEERAKAKEKRKQEAQKEE